MRRPSRNTWHSIRSLEIQGQDLVDSAGILFRGFMNEPKVANCNSGLLRRRHWRPSLPENPNVRRRRRQRGFWTKGGESLHSSLLKAISVGRGGKDWLTPPPPQNQPQRDIEQARAHLVTEIRSTTCADQRHLTNPAAVPSSSTRRAGGGTD